MKNGAIENEPLVKKAYYHQDGDAKYAGIHLLVELWQAQHLTDKDRIKDILLKAVNACGATVLTIDLHVFSPNGGVSGVAILKESHMSIHTWPEYEYAAVDVFVCGSVNPRLVLPVLESEFQPDRLETQEIKRGRLP